ncbi:MULTISPECIES: hypothetical protein [Vibrio]|uniref:hypothetical protein n=1 Tax=Vibrio TaxID=662 RepID=UPI0022CD20C6|nr:hypothetical protein [Vibrio sp. Makdt]MDA0155958.1 hypothetical protein [Vibrio sp. Makdt]
MNKSLSFTFLLVLMSTSAFGATFEKYVPTTDTFVESLLLTAEKLEKHKAIDISHKNVLIVDTSLLENKDYDKGTLESYKNLILVGNSGSVQKAMKYLLGFSVDGNSVLISKDNKGHITVKRYAPNLDISDDQRALGFLKLL